ncbi:MAG: thioredoxin [Candidatus Pacebacteria bacterium]|nr:thioredoxin [Candidatus Paceibacterota bacterium]
MIKELTDANFERATANGLALVDFWAPWCAPCRMQTPILEDVAHQIGASVTIAKVNVDDARATATRFSIRAIPTIVVMKGGEVVDEMAGVQSAEKLVAVLNEAAES